jgi:glycosyltransferase involved in cell wall biosynthesis
VILNLSDTSGFREFEFRDKNTSYQLETLFTGVYYRDISHRELRAALWPRLNALQPDLLAIQGWSYPYALAPLLWALQRGTPTITLSESQQIDFARSRWREMLKRRIVHLFQAGLVGGTPHADYLLKLGMPKTQIFLGYDVVDNDHFHSGAEAARASPRPTGLPTRYFLASCRFIPKKNLGVLISAYAAYKAAAPADHWSLVILGDGVQRPSLEQLCKELNVVDTVLMPGFKSYSELPVYYAWAGAFILPSSIEQWGLVVNEAMAAGLPVLVSDRCGCATDLVRNGENGFTFSPNDTLQLTELMTQIAHNCDRQRMSERSREIIADWSPQRFADGFGGAVDAALRQDVSPARLTDRLLVRALLGAQHVGRPKSE